MTDLVVPGELLDALLCSAADVHAQFANDWSIDLDGDTAWVAVCHSAGGLSVQVPDAWSGADVPEVVQDPLGWWERRYAACVRSPGRSPWRDQLAGVARSYSHPYGAAPVEGVPSGVDGTVAHTTEIWLLDGNYLRLTGSTDAAVGRTLELGQVGVAPIHLSSWLQPGVQGMTPPALLDALFRRPPYWPPLRALADHLDVDLEETGRDPWRIHRALCAAAESYQPTADEAAEGKVAGCDIVVLAELRGVCATLWDVADVLAGRWLPFR